jgi:lysophospholipase L1-like esterase
VLCRLNLGQAKGLHPKLIFLMIGHNNLMNNTPEQIYDGVAAIIAKYRRVCPDATIILQATFPTKEPGSKWRQAADALDKLLPKLAQGDKVAYIDFGSKFLSPDGTISKDVFPDGTHPAEKGFAIWAAAIQPILDQYFSPPVRDQKR